MKVLVFDVETAPLMSFLWQLRTDYVGHHMVEDESFMLTWAAKWLDGKKVYSDHLTSEEAVLQDDARLVESLADLIREADIVIAHNADKFDVPVLRARVLANGLEPLGPVKTIDTLKLAKKSFRFASNSLDYLGRMLVGDKKIKTDFDLWRNAYRGEHGALKEMVRYNKKDVILLEEVFEAMKPHVHGLPRMFDADADACPTCGGYNLVRRGYYRTNASTFVKFQCSDCGRYSRSRSSEPALRKANRPL